MSDQGRATSSSLSNQHSHLIGRLALMVHSCSADAIAKDIVLVLETEEDIAYHDLYDCAWK